MAVYTRVTPSDLKGFLGQYDLGEALSFEGIAEGVSNSNYKLVTPTGPFVVTLFEPRTDRAALPYFMALMNHLAEGGLACPRPVPAKDDSVLRLLSGRPAAIVSWLEGAAAPAITPAHAEAAGRALAKLHLLTAEFRSNRANDLGPEGWRRLIKSAIDRADQVIPNCSAILGAALDAVTAAWPKDLPRGTIHADYFPDNVFFNEAEVSGIIDFYFAATDILAYDLMIAVNAWAFDDSGANARYVPELGRALIQGYQAERPLSEAELAALPVLGQGAALRFLSTRLYDWLNTPPDAIVTRKHPKPYWDRLIIQSAFTGPASYGL